MTSKSGALSSSEFLRAYRTGILAGANATYSTIPKKVAKSYSTTNELLLAQNQRGVVDDLSPLVNVGFFCPTVPIPIEYRPLRYVSANFFESIPVGQGTISFNNTGKFYVTNTTNNIYLVEGELIQETSAPLAVWRAIASDSTGTKLAAAAEGGGIYTSSDSGITWDPQTSGLPAFANWYSIASSSNGTKLAAVVLGGGIYTSSNSGSNWTLRTSGLPASASWYSIASDSTGMKLAAVAYAGIYMSTDSGSNWTQRTSGLPDSVDWRAITSSSDGTKLAAVMYGGGIYRSTNSGVNWTITSAPSAPEDPQETTWVSIASSSDGTKLAAGGVRTSSRSGLNRNIGGRIWTSSDSGVNWDRPTNGLPSGRPDNLGQADWRGIAISSDGTKLVAIDSAGGGIYMSRDSGSNWNRRTGGGRWLSVASSSDGRKIAFGAGGIDRFNPTSPVIPSSIFTYEETDPTINFANLSTPYGTMQSQIDGAVYVVNSGNGSILKRAGLGVSYLVEPSASLVGMQTITQDYLSGNFYVTKPSGLKKVTPTGTVTSLVTINGVVDTTNYTGITYATNNNLYGTTTDGIYQISISTGRSSRIYSNTNLTGGIVQANDGYLYVTSVQNGGMVIQVHITGSAVVFTNLQSSIVPQSITQSSDEYLYVSSQNGNIYQIVVA